MSAYAFEQGKFAAYQRSVTATSESVKLVDSLYRSGLIDFQNVLDMQRSLTTQQNLLAVSRGAVASDFVRLYKALGGGWQTLSDQEFINAATRQEMAERTDWGGLLDEPQRALTESGEESSAETSEDSDWRWPDW